MFLDKYLSTNYLELLYDNYDFNYLNMLDEENFKNVYNILISNNFNFIEDIILNYIELFEIDSISVEKGLEDIKNILGNDYVNIISNNMSIFGKIIDLSLKYN